MMFPAGATSCRSQHWGARNPPHRRSGKVRNPTTHPTDSFSTHQTRHPRPRSGISATAWTRGRRLDLTQANSPKSGNSWNSDQGFFPVVVITNHEVMSSAEVVYSFKYLQNGGEQMDAGSR